MKTTDETASGNEDTREKNAFHNYIMNDDFPCIMAQTVVRTNKTEYYSYQQFGTDTAAVAILDDLRQYLENYNFEDKDFFTFVAAFPDEQDFTEEAFEAKLWDQLQYLHEADPAPWDPAVSRDPEDKHFSFSLLGRAFYIVGLHPGSSRIARSSPFPTIVFNLHFQFEKLKEMGSYDNIRDKIRERDIALQGNINPMVKDFGVASEARQYSGKEVGENWKCPFHHK